MESIFGEYRFSHTIEAVADGEPAWLSWLHDNYAVASAIADRGARR
jgi:hypothetical protein